MGKLFARVINNRLQLVVEEVVSDTQCGFRTGRGCVDMIFCVCQLVENTIEHNTKIFSLFVKLMTLCQDMLSGVLCISMVYQRI